MALIKCKECSNEVSSSAKVCPHCGYKLKSSGCGAVILIFALLAILLIVVSVISNKEESATGEVTLSTALSYLNDINEVRWVEYEGNDIFIGFSPRPNDLELVCDMAALNGNNAINFGVHVWAIDANKYNIGWRPGDGTYYYSTTARYGKIE